MGQPRRLILMRHAKSSWDSGAATDHARPLNKRGRRDAPRIALELSSLGWIPDCVISSDSQRTRETWAGMSAIFEDDIDVRFEPALYHAGLGELQEDAASWPDSATTVLVLGHNPGWERALGTLAGQWCGMTTANAAMLQGSGDRWADALERPWTMEGLLRPRELE